MSEMLQEGRIPLEQAEHDAVDKLIADNPGVPIGFTRRDSGETGPLLVTVDGTVYQVSAKGRVTKTDG